MNAYTHLLWLLPLMLISVAAVRSPAGPSNAPNRLINEKSPYLLEHAHNPVDWYPWGDEAFEAARQGDKPIFLSIGYSTCHWCHVMERESFENEEVAALLNDAFICVKVDREERPDIDGVYMDAAMLMTRRGGWPLTIIMTPDGEPFLAAAYIPRESRLGITGMLDLIPGISDMWTEHRNELLDTAGRVVDALRQTGTSERGGELTIADLDTAFRQLAGIYDAKLGGFGEAPKFPTPHNLTFLLRYWNRTQNPQALEMVEATLRAMRRGGIYDHVGFGFHRYSTDANWLLPHFEKMLYDQALLAMAYSDAYLATGDHEHARTAREVLTYVLRDMTDPDGGFYSAEDADSEGVEGKFYLWTEDEIRAAIPDAEAVIDLFGVSSAGNIAGEIAHAKVGANILHLQPSRPLLDGAGSGSADSDATAEEWEEARGRLLGARETQIRPHLDDKILTDWNGLMIAALARVGRALDEPEFTRAAERAAGFIATTLQRDGRLLHRYRDGEAALEASADDYAFLVWGLIELYESTFDTDHLERALELNDEFIARFWNEESGGFYFTPDDGEKLVMRRMDIYDGALPSANSVAMLNLLRLSHITGRTDLEERAAKVGIALSTDVRRGPAGYTQLMTAVDYGIGPSSEVIIAGDPDATDTALLLESLRSSFLPRKVVLLRPPGDGARIVRVAAYTEFLEMQGGKATVYVCRDHACSLPVTDADEMLRLLRAE